MIIGKSGKNVQDIKMATDATVRLSEFVPMHMERVLTVVGVPEAVGGVCRLWREIFGLRFMMMMGLNNLCMMHASTTR